jgi:hypothetical protein
MERISWTDPSGVRSKAVVGEAVASDHGAGHVTYMSETVRSITTEEPGFYRVNLQGGRQQLIRVPAGWVTPNE